MENVTRALIMAFSMLMFVVGFSYSMYLINSLTATSNALLSSVTTTNYYDNIKVSGDNTTTREVGIDTVISTLYRYYKETYVVKIIKQKNDGTEELIQRFDVDLEGKISNADSNGNQDNTELRSLKNSIYNTPGNPAYLFGAPWTTNTNEHTRARIDYFLHGTKGYINNHLVDYETTIGVGGFIGQHGAKTFTESFVEYAYEGETISTDEGVETITGSRKENSKIIITYTFEE